MNGSLLSLEGVYKQFGDTLAVDEVSFDVNKGEIFGFLGPNGAGKTTTLRMIMGILEPDKGSIKFNDLKRGSSVKSKLGYLPEERGLYEDAKTVDVLEYLGILKGLTNIEAGKRAEKWLTRLDLAEHKDSKIQELSKGMAQKIQFVASILHKPTLAVLDEPFAGLDPVNQDLFKNIIREMKSEGMTILLSSHRMNMVEELCDRIFMIHEGKEVLYGMLSEIKDNFGKDLVELSYRGDSSTFNAQYNEMISGLEIEDGHAKFYLEEGYSPQQLLRTLPEKLTIEEISIKKPPLHDIFVLTARGGGKDE